MTILSNVDYFKELPFFNAFLKNFNLLAELLFYDQLNIIKTDQAFKGYARSYKVEIVGKNDLIVQLEASKSSINDLLNERF